MGKSAFDIVTRLNSWHVPNLVRQAIVHRAMLSVAFAFVIVHLTELHTLAREVWPHFDRPVQSIMCYFWCLIIWAVFISMSAYWRPTKLGTWNVFEGFNAQELHLVFLIAVHWIDKGYISSIGLPWFNWSLIGLLWHRASGPDIFTCTADAGDKTRRDEKLCVARICVKLRPHKTRTRMSSFLFVFSACLS